MKELEKIVELITGNITEDQKNDIYYFPISTSRTSSNPNLVENPGWK